MQDLSQTRLVAKLSQMSLKRQIKP